MDNNDISLNSNFILKKYFSNPFVGVYDNVISNEECKHFINISHDKIRPSLVSGDEEGFISNGRTGQNHWIMHFSKLKISCGILPLR